MSGLELVEALALTGTGEAKLRVARAAIEARPGATAEDVLMALASDGKTVGAVTLEKARKLASGASVKEFLGSPPPNAEESRMRSLGREIGEAIVGQLSDRQAKAQADGVGIPELSLKRTR